MAVQLTGVAKIINDAVTDFMAAFAANLSLVRRGQFAISFAIRVQLALRVEAEFNTVGSVDSEVRAAFEGFNKEPSQENANAVLNTIKRKKLEKTLPETVKAFSPDPDATLAWANRQYDIVWGNTGISPPPSIINPTAQKAQVMNAKELDKCFDVTIAMANKLLTASGSTLTPNPSNLKVGKLGNAALGRLIAGRQTVSYDPILLNADIDRLKAAMRRDYLYLIGVESGLNHINQGKIFPDPEHYLLLFQHDDADTFVFWDSDASRSNITQLRWGQGFGLLFNRFNRFSTALDDPDFDNLVNAGDLNGDHINFPRRHRYQAYLAWPIP
jgi:hypothetical protein